MDTSVDYPCIEVMWVRGGLWDVISCRRQRKRSRLYDDILRTPRVDKVATRPRDLEFQVGDHAFLKVSPFKGVRRFGVCGKLSLHFIGPYEVLEWVRPVEYRVALPMWLAPTHDVFHISALRKYVFDPKHVIDFTPLELGEDFRYEERPVRILAREMKQLRNRVILY